MFDGFPDSVRDQLIDKHLSPDRLPTGFREGTNVLAVFDELRPAAHVPDVPLIVLSGTGVDAAQTMLVPENYLREQIAGSERLYADLVARPAEGGAPITANASHAAIPMVRPEVVAAAVRISPDRSAQGLSPNSREVRKGPGDRRQCQPAAPVISHLSPR